MHIIFTEEERAWMDMRKFGCPIKQKCPAKIRKSIKRKKKIIDLHEEKVNGYKHKTI